MRDGVSHENIAIGFDDDSANDKDYDDFVFKITNVDDSISTTSTDTIDLQDIINDSNINDVQTIGLEDGNQKVTIDLQEVVDLTDDNNDLVFTGDSGDIVDFNDSENWSKSDTTVAKTVNGEEGSFYEYTNTDDSSVSVFVEENIYTDF
jgi:hypothetical protein